ncbi:MAG: prepilin peptidase [Cohnella sp.]|nr:prepilin peptidase [Cohnella sp.]
MWADFMLVMLMAVCVFTDLKSRKIYNVVVYPALLWAIGVHALTGGWSGLAHSLLGFAVGLCLLLIPYLMGGMGAGDVKLLALVGALEGYAFVLEASVYMSLIGGVMAIGIILFKDGFRERMRRIGLLLLCLRFRMLPKLEGGYWTTEAYPYGVAIAGGSLAALALKGWGAG